MSGVTPPRTSWHAYAKRRVRLLRPSHDADRHVLNLALLVGAIVSAVNNKPSTCKYEPVIDGDYIPDITSKMLMAGKFTKVSGFFYAWDRAADRIDLRLQVPILAGHNAQDGSIFVGTPQSVVTDEDIVNAVLKRYPGLV